MKMMSGKESCQWAVGSCQGKVVSGQFSVGSGFGSLLPGSALSKC
jgi:hypothetical protein